MKNVENYESKKLRKNFEIIYENGQKIIKFDRNEIEKYTFQQYKSPISIDNVDINKIVVSNKVSLAKKNFK